MSRASRKPPTRIAFVVSHPIQYYAPLHQRLAQRSDVEIKVFFTWHAGQTAVEDRGFLRPVCWDIPLTEGYDFEQVPNISSDPGTHRFNGLRNPNLVERVLAWRPDVVHVTGWAWQSHLLALIKLSRLKVPVCFRGDSHLLDDQGQGVRRWLKWAVLRTIFALPAAFLYTGNANRAYYEAFGVCSGRLYYCPHSVDVSRFSGQNDEGEREAGTLREELGLSEDQIVLLFAGKFERKKAPLELMRAVLDLNRPDVVLLLVGSGELQKEVRELAASNPSRFRVMDFQNQSRMPVLYRVGDLFVLPSVYGETWGLAVNEAMACGRPVLVSDRAGCAADVVSDGAGQVFSWDEPASLQDKLSRMTLDRSLLGIMGMSAARASWSFDVSQTELKLVEAVKAISKQ